MRSVIKNVFWVKMFPHNMEDSTLAELSTGNTRLADKLLYGRMSVFYCLYSSLSQIYLRNKLYKTDDQDLHLERCDKKDVILRSKWDFNHWLNRSLNRSLKRRCAKCWLDTIGASGVLLGLIWQGSRCDGLRRTIGHRFAVRRFVGGKFSGCAPRKLLKGFHGFEFIKHPAHFLNILPS